jgi:parvulin-like peptidyl-prolyl isomerase
LSLLRGGLKGFAACGLLVLSYVVAFSVAAEPEAVFAKVGDQSISQNEFDAAVHIEMRQRFFHGRADEKRVAALRRKVAGRLIDNVLLLREARRRVVPVDEAELERQLQHEVARFRMDGLTEERKQQLLVMLQRQLREQARIAALEASVKKLPLPDAKQVQAYYVANLEKFTTPPRSRLAVILLKVAPSAAGAAWDAAMGEAQSLKQRLASGAKFAELAALHSGDASAESGGDLGFVHQGMLAAEAQSAVDALKEGEVSEPIALLQGVALFKLIERQSAVVNPFERAESRAVDLLQRERSEKAWERLLQKLRSEASIELFTDAMTITTIWKNEPATN